MQEALEMTKTEPDVYAILGEALADSVPDLQVEMLIAERANIAFAATAPAMLASKPRARPVTFAPRPGRSTPAAAPP